MFTFYATFDVDSLASYMPDVPVLLPASSWARKGLARPYIPSHVKHVAADSGGFVATRIWGDYRYSLAEYVAWLESFSPAWAAMMDYCCEPEITKAQQGIIRKRQDQTTAKIIETWQAYRNTSWVWVPTVQGWRPDDYKRHAEELRPLIKEMQRYYGDGSYFRVGVGTLCKRADSMTIRAVLQAIQSVLPTTPLHLWGIKLASLKSIDLTNVVSTDSATWHDKLYNNRCLKEDAVQSGMSAREYSIKVKLPAYIAKVHDAIARAGMLPNQYAAHAATARAALQPRGWTLHIRTRRARKFAYAARRLSRGVVEERYLAPLDDLAKILALGATLTNA